MRAMRVILFLASLAVTFAQSDGTDTHCGANNSGTWDDEDRNNFIARMLWGTVVGIVLGIVMVILTSLPLCCGVAKKCAKVFATLGIICGLICIIIPYIGAATANCQEFMDTVCKSCTYTGHGCPTVECTGCDDDFKELFINNCNLIGGFVAYVAWGWLAAVLGIFAIVLGGCIFCGCCKMANDQTAYVAHGQTGQYQPPTSYA